MLKKIFWTHGVVFPCPMAMYMYMTIHNIETSSSLKPLGHQSQTFCGASLGRGNESLYKWSRSHDQDGRHNYK